MQINGLNKIPVCYKRTLILFIYGIYGAYDDLNINIEFKSDNLFRINDENFIIISPEELKTSINNLNQKYFAEKVSEVPDNWKPYIDKDKWIKGNSFKAEEVLYYMYIDDNEFPVGKDNYFYQVANYRDYFIYQYV